MAAKPAIDHAAYADSLTKIYRGKWPALHYLLMKMEAAGEAMLRPDPRDADAAIYLLGTVGSGKGFNYSPRLGKTLADVRHGLNVLRSAAQEMRGNSSDVTEILDLDGLIEAIETVSADVSMACRIATSHEG